MQMMRVRGEAMIRIAWLRWSGVRGERGGGVRKERGEDDRYRRDEVAHRKDGV
jgi:hypothetical protein